MFKDMEELIRAVYRRWKAGQSRMLGRHPDEEELACFLEGRLSAGEASAMKAHLAACEECSRKYAFSLRLAFSPGGSHDVPPELLKRVKELPARGPAGPVLEIWLRLREKILELVSTTGDVLVGQELVPAPLLRSRKIRDFKGEISVFKDFERIRVEIKIEKKTVQAFNLAVAVKEKQTQNLLKDLRVALTRGGVELESYAVETGGAVFENVSLGEYLVEVAGKGGTVASIILDVRA